MRLRWLLRIIPVLLLVIGSFGLFLRPAHAASIVWNNANGDGLWSTDGNWVGGTKPGASDIATFNSTSTANSTIDATFAGSVAGISIASTYSGTITQARSLTIGSSNYSQVGGTFTGASQDITINGTFSLTGGTFNSTSGNLTVTSTLTISSGAIAFNAGSGTVTSTGTNATWDINSSQSWNNLVINKTLGNSFLIGSGDTMVVLGTLTLTQGGISAGTIDTRGNTTQGANFSGSGSTTIIDFGDNAVAQTYTVNGGSAPIIRLDSASDANDSVVLAAAATFTELRMTSGFSGTIPFSNSGNFTPTFTLWNQAAGTYDASAQTGWNLIGLTISGGTFTAPTTTTMTAGSGTYDVNTTQTFNNITVNKTAGNTTTIASGDTLVVTGTLTLTQGGLATGTVDTRGNITQASNFNTGSSAIIDFGDNSVAQTYTLNGGNTPIIRFDNASDANDSLVLAAATTIAELRATAGFSGAIPFSNSGNFTPTFTTWTQAAGTYDGSAQTGWNVVNFAISGGTFTPPITTTATSGSGTWDFNSSQTFNNVTINKAAFNTNTLGSGDTMVVTGTLTLTQGGQNTGTVDTRGNISQGASFTGGTSVIDFGDNSVAQTYTIASGSTTPVVRLDNASDANDSITLSGAATFTELRITSGFSGTIPLSNSGNFTPTFTLWNQAAGTYDASAQTTWNIVTLTISGGTFTAPTTVNATGGGTTWDINSSQTFNNLTINKTAFNTMNLGSNDTFVVTGTMTFTQAGVSTGTIDARGNVTVGASFNSGNTTLLFSGSANQTFTLTGATGLYDGDINVNKSGGQVTLASALVLNAANQDLDIQEGTFNLAGNNLTVNGTSGTTVVEDGGTLKLYGSETTTLNASMPTIQSGSTVMFTGDGDSASDTYTVTTLKAAYHHLTINSTDGATDTFQLGAAIDMNGDFTLTAGTFDVTTNNYQMNVAGNWAKSGTFTARSGTVILDGTNQTLTGATSFYNLTKNVSSAATLTLPASTTTTITHTANIQGASSQLLSLRSSTTGTQTSMDFQGTRTFSYLDVKDNNSINASPAVCGSTCVNSGNTTNWTFAPGFTVSAISGNTTEAGGTATFTVVLAAPPSADVTIPVSSNDTTEGTVSTSSLTFTSGNWNTPQTVTVTGVNDDLDDGDIAYSIVLAAATSADSGYNGLNPSDVSVTNTDNDTSGFTVSSISGNTTEAAGTATFTVVLTAQPTADVTVGVTSNDTTEGTVSASSLTFTSGNWSTPQTVTVTGVNDDLDDGDIAYTIVLAAATSADTNYNGLNPADVSVTNTDNDTSGFTVSAISGHTTESTGTATFTVVLTAQPTASVSIGVTSDDTTEGTVSTSSLSFTTGNWSTPQTVTVTGVNDFIVDGNITYHVVLAAASSSDTNYNGLNPNDVTVINDDDDVIAITASSISGNTTEDAGTATFTVVLGSQPSADVTVGVSSNDLTEGTVSPSSLTFTSGNWSTPQTVTVTGVDDAVDDGNIAYSIVLGAATSADSAYNGVNPADVSVTNTDNDTAGFTVSAITGHTSEAGATQTFTVALTSQPTANVTIGITSSDTTEGTVFYSSFVFTSSDWNSPQTEYVTGVDDLIIDGNITYSAVLAAATSSDPNYNGLNPNDVSVVNDDDDVAGFVISTISQSTTEDGRTGTFTMKLKTMPSADVVIGVSSSDTTEGTVSPSSLTFTNANWNSNQTVTVTGVDDVLVDGDISYSIVLAAASSADTDYNGLNPSDVSVLNLDNDVAHFTVTDASANTTENGGTATFTVVLDTQPTADVTTALSTSDATEGTIDKSSLTFTSANWDTPQTVTITGVNDDINDGDVVYHITLAAATSADTQYNGLNPTDVFLQNIDNDNSEFVVSAISGNTTEGGVTATFTVRLASQPSADVTIGVSSSDTTEGTVDVSSLTFTSSNWSSNQTVTVTGVNDAVSDGNIVYSIVLDAATSTDVTYDGVDPADVTVTNVDDDTPGFNISAISNGTNEGGQTATFTVSLASQPLADVTIGVSSSDTTEGTVDKSSLTFTSANWDTLQTVTVTGVDDYLDDGNINYSIILAAASSADTGYNGLNPNDVSTVNADNDASGFAISAITGHTTEAGDTATFTVELTSQPVADVVIGVSSSNTNEGTVSPSSLTFTGTDWNSPQTVTVTGVDDVSADGNISYTIILAAASSADPTYDTLNPADVGVVNDDDDATGITVSAISGDTTELGVTATFTVVLASQPSADVTIAVSSDDTTEGTVSPSSLTFTNGNWSTPQTVTVTGVNDDLDDGDVDYHIVLDPAVSADLAFNDLDPNDVTVTNIDNDTSGFTVSAISGNTTEAGGTATFTVVLTAQPTADVAIGVTSDDTTEGTVSPASLTFTAVNWSTPKTVTVTGVNDFLDDGDVDYSIVLAAASSSDTNYNGLNPSDVSVTNTDNDTFGITVGAITGNTTEAGGTASFTVVLNSQPSAEVDIGVSSDNTAEGTVSTSSLAFTSGDWSTPQTVTVTGVDDMSSDGDVIYHVVLAAATSSDTDYNGLNPADVSVTNTDNDSPGFTVSSISGNTTEAGGTATFTVQLNTEPTDDVTIGVSSSNTSEGTVSTAFLTFTNSDWDTPQTVTVTGVNDDIDDGNVSYSIVLGAATSLDVTYDAMNPNDVSVINSDDDTAGITLTEAGGTTDVTEGGATDTYTLVLTSEPTDDVTITVSPDAQLSTDISSATFTAANWDTPQTITVTAVNDTAVEGDHTGTITHSVTSLDVLYDGMAVADVTATITDNDSSTPSSTGTTGYVPPQQSSSPSYAMKVLTPVTGDVFEGGSVTTISWSSSGFALSYVNLAYTINQGQTFTVIASGVNNTGSYVWTLPKIESDAVVVRVIGTDLAVNLSVGYSGLFSIHSGLESVTPVEIPNPTDISTAISPFTGKQESVTKVAIGDYIKSPEASTVYYVDENYVRRPFYDAQTYFTYQDSFNAIKQVTGATLTLLNLGNPMLPKSGVVLVKIQSSSKVYAVAGGILLRWIPSEEVATELYGSAWADYVIDLSPTLFYHFVTGPDMSLTDTVDLTIMKLRMDLHE